MEAGRPGQLEEALGEMVVVWGQQWQWGREVGFEVCCGFEVRSERTGGLQGDGGDAVHWDTG